MKSNREHLLRTKDERLPLDKHEQKWQGRDELIRCRGCGKEFSLTKCRMATGTLTNTLTGLPDHNTPHAVCTHCGFAT